MRTLSYGEFLAGLAPAARERVEKQVRKVRDGKFGNCKKLRTFNNRGNTTTLCECVIDFGPGYRVYFTESATGPDILAAGTKKTQRSDIENARAMLEGESGKPAQA